ncbi:MAG: MG2 domain-containing protein [Synergistaceae bacterium]|nr:MG2 domain-containing protein [Synergistaceae bacterium]
MNIKKYRLPLIALFVAAAAALLLAPGLTGFKLRSFSPSGVVSEISELTARFNCAVVSDEVVGMELPPSAFPFETSPPLSGSGRWSDASTFVFTPRGGRLAQATRYRVFFNPELRDARGRRLARVREFFFNTPAPVFNGAKQVNFNSQSGRTVFELDFSLPVAPERLRGYLDIMEGSRRLEYYIEPGAPSKKLRLSLLDRTDKETRLFIAAGLPCEAGPLVMEKDVNVKLEGVRVMELRDSSASSGMDGGRILIETTAPADLAKAAAFITLSPETKFTVEPRSDGFAIAGDFAPQQRVKVTVKKGLPSLSGETLAKDWSRAFIFPDTEPRIRFPEDGRVLSPADSLLIPIESVNFDKLRLLVWQLYGNNIPLAMRSEWDDYPTDLSRLAAEKEYIVRGKPNETARRALDLKPLLGGGRGVFLIRAYGVGARWGEAEQLVNVTDLGLTLKMGKGKALARVLSISKAAAVAGARVTLWSWSNQIVGEGRTDARGLASISITEGEAGAPVIALAEKDGDCAFIRLANGLYNGSDSFDTSGMAWLSEGYSAFCYTPRDIFRPGETIPLFAVTRGANGKAPSPFPLTMKLFSPGGKMWTSRTEKLTAEGVFAASLDIPADAPTGLWNISLYVPGGESPVGQKDIYIEEFAAPRLFVEASAKPEAITGEGSATLNISARYTFGNPAAGMSWEAELRTVDRSFAHESWKSFSFRDEELKFVPDSIFIGSGQLGEEGGASCELNGGGWAVPSMADISVRAGVMDDAGRWTYQTINIPWYPAEVMTGIEAPREVAPGRKISFRAAAVTHDGAPAGVKELKYSLFRRVRQYALFDSDGRMTRETREELIPRGDGLITIKDGVGSASVTTQEAGEYLLRVESADGKSRASAVIRAYGAGGGDDGGSFPDIVEVTTDKKIYKVGDRARIKIKPPFAGLALVDVETTSALWSEGRAVGGEAEFTVTVTEAMKPNGWITAQVVRPSRGDGEPVRAFGTAPLMVDNGASRLNVEIDAPAHVKPGRNEISLLVKDAAGRGAAADVTVMLVDETVLGLTGFKTPRPWNWFTDRRQLGMETYDLYGALIRLADRSTPLLTAGGGAAEADNMLRASLSPVQARRFKMLSITARTRSGSDGRCRVTLDLPEFSGSARIMAVAASAAAVGSGERALRINREVVTEASMPRFAAPGDIFEAPCRLFNMTDKPLTVKLSVSSTEGGARLVPVEREGAGGETSVTIEGGGSAIVPLAFRAEGVGAAKISYSTLWGGGGSERADTTIELPLRPAAPRLSESGSAVIEPGKKWSFSAPAPEKNAPDNFASGVVMLSAMPQLSLSALADFLVTYPYGCFEQTVSSAWPLLAQPELVRQIDPELADESGLAARIARIEAAQLGDGGFPRWNGEYSRPWESLYGAHFLLEAKRMGRKVSPEALRYAADYARALLPAEPDSESDEAWSETLSRRAYAAFVLTLSGEAPLGWMESLREKTGQMAPSGRLLLACAFAAAGEKEAAEAILGEEAPAAADAPGKNDNYDSALRNSALTLLARTYIDPAGAAAAGAASGLISRLNAAPAFNTQEGGFAMAALGRWFAARPKEGAPAGRLIKEPEGNTAGRVSASERSFVTKSLGSYRAENSGRAALYAAWTVSYIPEGALPQRDNGIEIRLNLTNREGKAVTDTAQRGESLTAALTVTPKAGAPRSVAAVMPLPAGLEIENPRLTEGEEKSEAGVRAEIRDDRLILFIDELREPLTWRCSLRAATAGTFAVPQIYAECMYDPGISSVSGKGGTIRINEAK